MQGADAQIRFFNELHSIREMLDALQSLPDALFMIKDQDSRYVYMSRDLKRAIHLSPDDEIVGKTDFDLFPQIVAEQFRQNDLLVLRDGRTLLNEIHVAVFFDKSATWSFSSKWPLRNARGEIIGLVTTNRRYADVMGQDDELNQLLPAIDWITRNYDQRIVVADLAEKCSLSGSHFMRVFRDRLGTTVHQFLDQVRLHHAIYALKHSSNAISSIALGCGFYDHSAFVKRFKKLTGSTPLKFRQDWRRQQAGERPIALPDWAKK